MVAPKVVRNRRRKGSILLETGLALPVFGLLLIGGVDFGRLMVAQQSLVSAARAGAQAAVLQPDAFTEAQVRHAIEHDNPGAVQRIRLERFTAGERHYLRITVENEAAGLLGLPQKTLSAQAVVRLPQ